MGKAAATPNFDYGYPTPGSQCPTPQDVMDSVFFMSEDEWHALRAAERFDHIVVGSGFCALAFVERILERQPRAKVLVLERGPFFLPEHFQNLPLPYQRTLGGLSETFPWTLSAATAGQPPGKIGWQHGMVPFFGGRSILWSAWCPRPLESEFAGWSPAVVEAARRNFDAAEKLLNVVPADRIDADLDGDTLARTARRRPIYGILQRRIQSMLAENLGRVPGATRSMAAPIAVGAGIQEDLDFAKFSTPGPLLDLVDRQRDGGEARLRLVTGCVVQRLLQQGGTVTALETSRGTVNVGGAKVILAMGALPPATLLLNSFPALPRAGERFTAHFITAVVARVPRAAYPFAGELAAMELAAVYMAGLSPSGMQFHVQLSVLSDRHPEKNAQRAARYAPDVVATASPAQLRGSGDHLVFVCAVLGELDAENARNWQRLNGGGDPTTNVTLQVVAGETDEATWDAMDAATFAMLEGALSPDGAGAVEYWHGAPDHGAWCAERPPLDQRRVPGLVHEGSPLWIDPDPASGVVGTDYRPHGVSNVYVTGAGLWPRSGSWNPTLTMVALAQDLADQVAGPADATASDLVPTPDLQTVLETA